VTLFGAKSAAAVAESFRREANPEFTALHLDHVAVVDAEGNRDDWERWIQEGLDLGFESVMLDASRVPLEENIAATRKVVAMARKFCGANDRNRVLWTTPSTSSEMKPPLVLRA
jgi:fructose/tagatose bisphosphate aldolase